MQLRLRLLASYRFTPKRSNACVAKEIFLLRNSTIRGSFIGKCWTRSQARITLAPALDADCSDVKPDRP